MNKVDYRCPTCGFQILNRRFPKCEKCGAALPANLLFTREQKTVLDAEHEKSRKEREARMREARKKEGKSSGGDLNTMWGGNDYGGGGEGGGGDGGGGG